MGKYQEINIRGFGALAIVIITAVVLAIGGFFGYQYLLLQKIQEGAKPPAVEIAPPPASVETQPQSEEIDTSDWKTYRSKKYGFEVRYPVEFLGTPILIEEDFELTTPVIYRLIIFRDIGAGEIHPITLEIIVGSNVQDRFDYYLSSVNVLTAQYPRAKLEMGKEFLIKGRNAKQFYLMNPHISEFGSDRSLITVWNNGSLLYEFALNTAEDDDKQVLYNQILSTFKFIE